ncbi:hypothetical protein C6988_05810 [Nitrosopumilus sp. b1]|uniref:Ig-like domain-containing protein n=1 Tax=Nitrosopumilus sp. b1 TaxID=2109907 RepID=UPI0015F625F7|nr:Ig-like domain-containing protein [Nitrosopumilus sp. b1]KAF6242705.1 hypothetical protein C6988_05810 [Nitrosopumilus sp. b1]
MNQKIPVLFFSAILFTSSFGFSEAQILVTNLDHASLELRLAPSRVISEENVHLAGYINLIDSKGTMIKPSKDVRIFLESDKPGIAKVPELVTIQAEQGYASFFIETFGVDGSSVISATFNDQTISKKFFVGEKVPILPDTLDIVINLPSNEMHVSSEMPFSVYLIDDEKKIIQAPYDITIDFEYEDSLISLRDSSLTINKGNYYSWSTILTKGDVGNAFIRATQDDLNIHSAKNIRISSSLPASLDIDIFPKFVPKEVDRTVEVIVSLVDADGNPTLATEDIPLEFFSDYDYVGRIIDDKIKESLSTGVIKKGEFSHHFQIKMNLNSSPEDITIGASTKGLGIASDMFTTADAMNFENKLIAENKTMIVYTLEKIPSDSTTIAVYQIIVEEEEDEETEETAEESSEEDEEPITIPVISNENFQSKGSLQKINLISSDDLLLHIIESGKIESGKSYGIATIKSGKENGIVTLASTLKGVGSGTVDAQIINTLRHDKTKIFSPTGPNMILFDKTGNFDIFVISLDSKGRPTIVEDEARFLLSPVNEMVEIKRNKTFSHATLHSTSFIKGESSFTINAIPIGISADSDLETSSTYSTEPSAKIRISLPYSVMDSNAKSEFPGVIQITDFNDNPIHALEDIKIQLITEESDLLNIPRNIQILKGESQAIFPIMTNGIAGESKISANAKGAISSESSFETRSFLTKLEISTGGIIEPLPVNQPVTLDVYVDDENLEPVDGAIIQISSINGVATPTSITTDNGGIAKIRFTANDLDSFTSLQIIATAEGYLEESETFEFEVDVPEVLVEEEMTVLGLPEWVIYVGIAGILVIVGIIVMFLKKPKQVLEDEDEIYEEDEI